MLSRSGGDGRSELVGRWSGCDHCRSNGRLYEKDMNEIRRAFSEIVSVDVWRRK
jgi:hypothetical protein